MNSGWQLSKKRLLNCLKRRVLCQTHPARHKEKVNTMKEKSIGPKFNYCVGTYWPKDYFSDGKSIGTYTYHHDVFYGTMAEAEEFLAYVKRQSPDKDWQIFKIVPLTAV